MTPFGHLSVSYLAGGLSKKISIPAILAGGLIMDIDFIFFTFPWFNEIHRIVTHNIFFLVIISFIGSLISLRAGRRKIIFLSIFMGGILHLFIDAIMDSNPSNGIGVAFLWPLIKNTFSPFNILDNSKNLSGWDSPFKQFKSMIPVILIEIPFYIGALVLLWYRRRRKILKNN